MSVSSLLDDNSDKSWANLYVNNLKCFNDLTVCGNFEVDGKISIDNLERGPPDTYLHTTPTEELVWKPIDLIKGDIGPAGPKGEAGSVGTKGDQGIQGIKGDSGQPGPKGDKGEAGIKGEVGVTGQKGDIGDTGQPGPKGDQGIQGIKGEDGALGPPGSKGDKGDSAAPGIGLDGQIIRNVGGSTTWQNEIIQSNIPDLSISNTKIATSAVTSDKIANDNIITSKLANLGVTEAKLADGSVSLNKLGLNSVSTTKIQNQAVTPSKIQVGAVGQNLFTSDSLNVNWRYSMKDVRKAGASDNFSAKKLTTWPTSFIANNPDITYAAGIFTVPAGTYQVDVDMIANRVGGIGSGNIIFSIESNPVGTTYYTQTNTVINTYNFKVHYSAFITVTGAFGVYLDPNGGIFDALGERSICINRVN